MLLSRATYKLQLLIQSETFDPTFKIHYSEMSFLAEIKGNTVIKKYNIQVINVVYTQH